MRQLSPDLWETQSDNPFPGLTTHAYLWTGGPAGNVLFYSTLTDTDFDQIESLGGIAHQYLSHRDEAGPMLARIKARFGAQLHASAAELTDIEPHAPVDVTLAGRHLDNNGVEAISTPGHSPGSVCYLVSGSTGDRYLFTGDTIIRGEDGRWFAGYIPSISDASALSRSLESLGTLTPDLVLSSAFSGAGGAHRPDRPWADCVAEAHRGLLARQR